MSDPIIIIALCLLFSAAVMLVFAFLQVRFGGTEDLDPNSLVVRLFARRDAVNAQHRNTVLERVRHPVLRKLTVQGLRFERSAIPRNRLIIGLIIICFVLAMPAMLATVGNRTIPSIGTFPRVPNNHEDIEVFLGKLIATILVYSMQFGFVAFEAGAVRQNYKRQSAVKNLIVFAVAFMAYEFFGWKVQHSLNPHAISSLLDVAFNAGFASTVALITANTITERGTLLVNSLSSMVAAGLAYPLVAGLLFDGGMLARNWGFVDTAGGCVVHVLGAAFGLAAAFWIGPRSIRQAWHLLGKVEVAVQRDNTFSVIGAFFLWFGWLGFNSGSVFYGASTTVWSSFLVAFTNTSIGASAGGLLGFMIAVANMGVLRTTDSRDLTSGGVFREISHLERVVLGMLGGLVAVTANASRVEPWQALVEAMCGALVAIVGSALMTRHLRNLDDPLGAIATHGFAGVVGVVCTGMFRTDFYSTTFPHGLIYSVGVQALGCLVAISVGLFLASLSCGALWVVERSRIADKLQLKGLLLRLTAYEEQTGKISTEFWVPPDDVDRALERIREGPPKLVRGGDLSWIAAVQVLALSDRSNEEPNQLFGALDQLLETRYQGSSEEQTAIAALAACGSAGRLPILISRALAHRAPDHYPDIKATQWADLDPLYTQTLIVSISELAESFAIQYDTLREQMPRDSLSLMKKSFRDAYNLLEEVAKEREPGGRLWEIAQAHVQNLRTLSMTGQILSADFAV